MQDPSALVREMPLEVFDAPRCDDSWFRCPLAQASDRDLVEAVAGAIAQPKETPGSSFVLHAPLELLARSRLLACAAPAARVGARRRIAEIGARYAHAGPEAAATARDYADEAAALPALLAALAAGDAEEADGALGWLLPRRSTADLVTDLADAVIPALGAAAHAPILLANVLRLASRIGNLAGLLRAPLRYLALQAGSRLTWQESAPTQLTPTAADLFDVLVAPPHVDCASMSIAPTMLAVEAHGLAERLLAGPTATLTRRQAEPTLLRIAAWSMLQDDPRHAPYGWTHCLTLPQGVLALASVAEDQRAAVRVAATQVLGFRATLGRTTLDPAGPPLRKRRQDLAGAEPSEAAAIAFHAPAPVHAEIVAFLAGRAAGHADAHLAKYTLACFDAAIQDPEAAALYLAAAAFLGAWWEANPRAKFGD
jgi:hypothetical protein